MKLCGCLAETTLEKCIELAINTNLELFEHRIDYQKEKDNLEKMYSINKEFIATCRNVSCGGKFNGTEEERIDILINAINSGAKFVDIEIETNIDLIKKICFHAKQKGVKVIISKHDFATTPPFSELITFLNKEKELGADIGKIVCLSNNPSDANNLLSLIDEGKKINFPVVAFGMGEQGKFSRVASLIRGSPFTYISIKTATAPGQIELSELKNILGVVGNPIEHSKSPLIHNSGIKSKKLKFSYYPFKTENIDNAINVMRELGIRGYSVTIPHKSTCIQYIDKLDPFAKSIGAVNTIVNSDGVLTGFNTDYLGAINALKSKVKLSKKRVYVFGTGGAARAIIFGLVQEKAIVKIFGRNMAHSIELADEFSCGYGHLQEIDKNYDILINTTPVGMYPNTENIPVPETILTKGKVVFDIVYNPLETELLKKAKKAGCKTISGVEMFLEQAYVQFELFTKKSPPKAVMRRILLSELKKEQEKNKSSSKNIFLIGYRGTGKTSVGKKLADLLKKQFIDIDKKIVELAEMNIPDIFATKGEKKFRAYETKVLKEISKKSNQVISCGGGIVTVPGNIKIMKKKGVVVLLESNPKVIYQRIYGDKNRPSLTNKDPYEEIVFMLEKRKELYHSAKDFVVNTDEFPDIVEGKKVDNSDIYAKKVIGFITQKQ